MLAMTYRDPFRARVSQKVEPKIEHPEDCIVRIFRSRICGSGQHFIMK